MPEEEPETAGATPQPAKQYITDLVGEDYKNWHGIVVLDAGTNSGKTYFILKTLLPWAYEHRKRILILCNREALRNQIARDVNRLGSIEVSYEDYDPALGGTVNKTAIDNKYEHTIYLFNFSHFITLSKLLFADRKISMIGNKVP